MWFSGSGFCVNCWKYFYKHSRSSEGIIPSISYKMGAKLLLQESGSLKLCRILFYCSLQCDDNIIFCKWFGLRIQFCSLQKIGSVACPTLFISGTNDELLPPTMMNELYSKCSASVKLLQRFPGSHNDTWTCKEYVGKIAEFISVIKWNSITSKYWYHKSLHPSYMFLLNFFIFYRWLTSNGNQQYLNRIVIILYNIKGKQQSILFGIIDNRSQSVFTQVLQNNNKTKQLKRKIDNFLHLVIGYINIHYGN